MITQTYDLNMIPGGVPVRVPVSQYDADSRGIVFNLYAGEWEFTVPSGAVVTCDGTKPDHKGFSYTCDYLNNQVVVGVTQQMAAVAGVVECQITINKDGRVLGSANFVLAVEKATLGDGTDMSESEMSALVGLSAKTAENAQKAQEVLNDINDAQEELDDTITAAGTAQSGLETAIATANTADTNLTDATTAANTARASLTSATTDANTARTALEAATTAAGTAEASLEAATQTANTAKGQLDAANETAEDNLAALGNAEQMAQKMPLVPTAAEGHLAAFNASGGVEDSGKAPGDFAPGGYGYGGTMPTIFTDSDEDGTVFEGLVDAVLAEMSNLEVRQYLIRDYPALSGTTFVATLFKYNANYAVINAVSYTGTSGQVKKTKQSGVWNPFEWVHPAMAVGTEYRTTERYRGKSVYTVVVPQVSAPNNTTKSYAHGYSMETPIRWSGVFAGEYTLPYVPWGNKVEITVSKTNIYLTSNYDASAQGVYVQIWYTKP